MIQHSCFKVVSSPLIYYNQEQYHRYHCIIIALDFPSRKKKGKKKADASGCCLGMTKYIKFFKHDRVYLNSQWKGETKPLTLSVQAQKK